jgi:hypothetical protein
MTASQSIYLCLSSINLSRLSEPEEREPGIFSWSGAVVYGLYVRKRQLSWKWLLVSWYKKISKTREMSRDSPTSGILKRYLTTDLDVPHIVAVTSRYEISIWQWMWQYDEWMWLPPAFGLDRNESTDIHSEFAEVVNMNKPSYHFLTNPDLRVKMCTFHLDLFLRRF